MPEFDMDFGDTMERAFDASESGTEVASPPATEPEQTELPGTEQAADSQDEPTQPNPDQGGEQATEQPADAPAPLDPPARWSADDKAAFAALPRDAQDLVLKRERDVEQHLSRRTQELSEKDRRYEAMDQVLASVRPELQAKGLNEAAVVGELFSMYGNMQRDPAGFVRWFTQQKGIDLETMESADPVDPAINALRSQVAQQGQMLTQWQQAQQKAALDQVKAHVSEFREAKGDDGQPLHPHFAALESHMSALITQGVTTDLKDAYEQAVWANPETRSALMGQQAKAEQAKREAEAKAKASAAEKAAGTRPRSSNGQFVTAPGKSQDDTMAAVYDRMNG